MTLILLGLAWLGASVVCAVVWAALHPRDNNAADWPLWETEFLAGAS